MVVNQFNLLFELFFFQMDPNSPRVARQHDCCVCCLVCCGQWWFNSKSGRPVRLLCLTGINGQIKIFFFLMRLEEDNLDFKSFFFCVFFNPIINKPSFIWVLKSKVSTIFLFTYTPSWNIYLNKLFRRICLKKKKISRESSDYTKAQGLWTLKKY